MKKFLSVSVRSLLLSGLFLLMSYGSSYATHIFAEDLRYTWVSGNTYTIEVIVYANCGGSAYPTLGSSRPIVCTFNGSTLFHTDTLTLRTSDSGSNVTQVCPADLDSTTCTNLTYTLQGTARFFYSKTITLSGASALWRFRCGHFAGSDPGRSSSITNVSGAGSSVVYLEDTLNNSATSVTGHNSSPTFAVLPTPYYCDLTPNTYSPVPSDPDGDVLNFSLVSARTSGAGCGGTVTNVTYAGGFSGAAPIAVSSPITVSSTTGEISFNPNALGTDDIVYNVEERRGGVLVGTCQREMTFIISTCTLTPPSAALKTPSTGVLTDSFTLAVCNNAGPFTVNVRPTISGGYLIYADTLNPSGLPAGMTFSVTADSTAAPVITLGWTTVGVPVGTYTFYLSYFVNSCPVGGTSTVGYTINIDSAANTITGTKTVCPFLSTTLSDYPLGGTWSSAHTNIATVGSTTGVVWGVLATGGTDSIIYTESPAQCKAYAVVTVNVAPVISGTTGVCQTLTTTLTATPAGGTWSTTSGAIATVGSLTGIVTGVGIGTTIVTYAQPSPGCIDTAIITVSAEPKVIVGPSVVCALQTITLTDSVSGGTWTSGNGAIATVGSNTGVVTGVGGGTVDITYSTSPGCQVVKLITVNPAPSAITGTTSICVGSSSQLTSLTTGGTWSSGGSSIATVGSTGIVTGVTTGTTTITYTIPPAGCWDTIVVTVTSGVSPITGTLNVCTGQTTQLNDLTVGGTWSSSATTIATVGSTGIVTGVLAGTDTIKYSLSGGCFASAVVTVSTGPAAISPSAGVSVCVGSTTPLADGTPGGTWSSGSTSVATVGSTGIVTGVTTGTATISYTIGTCTVTKVVTVTAVGGTNTPASATLCIGSNTIFTNTSSGGTWTSSNPAIATIGLTTGTAGGVAIGTATVTYTIGTCTSISPVTVNTSPSAIAPSGPISICSGSSTPFADVTPGGVWSSSNNAIATVGSTGTVWGVSPGVDTISYTVGGCAATKTVTVTSGGSPILPGTATICTSNTVNLTNATPGGTWTSGSPTVATVGSTGIVTGVTAGVATISYTSGTCISTATVTVNAGAAAITPAGGATLCIGSTFTFSDATPGGVWSSTATGVATVGSTGIVTGVGAGVATISYTTGSCAAITTVTVTSSGSPIVPSSATICIGTPFTFTDAATGGTWSLGGSAIATITGTTATTATVNGISSGTAILTYTQGTCTATAPITVSTAPAAITPATPISICTATTTPLADPTPGGVWTRATPGVAKVGSTGKVTGVSAGTVTISYSIGGCAATKIVTVTAGAAPISPSAPMLCTGNTLTLLDAATGGTWSSLNPAVATITAGGMVTGVTVGTAVISYTLGSCGTSVTVTVSLGADAGAISGPTHLCTGGTVSLTETVSGGTWSSSSAGIASVGSTGIVGGVTAGVVTISYSVTNGCGTTSATHLDTVFSTAGPGPIVGPATLCAGLFTTLTDSDPGGTWSVSNSHASVTPTGLFTGISPGIDTVTYTVTNSCGSASVTKAITIGTFLTAGTITGPSSICGTGTILLADATTGGVWSSGNIGIATVDGSGNVTGVSNGVDTISYTVTSACGSAVATHTVTVSPGADAGSIIGASPICVGNFTIFTDAAPGGVWASVNGNATVTSGGLVTGMAPGTDSITYTVTNSCGSVTAIKSIVIIPSVSAGTITGPGNNICLGSTISLADAAPGGVWSTSNGSASVSTVGLVTGLAGGVDTILYTVASTCGNAVATYVVTVSPTALTAGVITGPSSVCVSSEITLADTVAGGVWSSSNANATITFAGVVTGVLPGRDTITYTVTGACGIAQTTHLVTVNSLPVPGSITGPSSLCVGSSDTLGVTGTTGGGWSSSDPSVAIGSTSGIVTGVSTGTSTITYSLTNVCGTVIATMNIVVNPIGTVLPISGVARQCLGGTSMLFDGTPGGVWSSSNPARSTVDASTGVVTGISLGVDTIYYNVTNVFGCVASAQIRDTVQTLPVPAPITGPHHACQGVLDTLSNAILGGSWSSSNVSVATIDILTGQMLNVGGGSAIIYYVVSNSCGSITDTTLITVNPAPNAGVITGPDSLCGGTTITLTDTVSGGFWSSSNHTVATVGSTGIVYGLGLGADTIYYTLTNGFGCAGSASKIIHVANILPSVTFSPSGTATLCRGHYVYMSVVSSSGAPSLTYQWYQDGTPIPGATNSNYSTYTTGSFKVVVSNGVCNITLTGTSVILAPPNPVIAYTPPDILYTSSFLTYQWFLNWVPIPGATNSLIHETANGVYHVVVTDVNGCTDTSGQYSVVVVSGVNTIVNPADVKIYPNPASSVLHIDAPVKVSVSILSVDGKVLMEQKDASDINISPLANGMYMVMIYDENKLLIKTTKFAKVE